MNVWATAVAEWETAHQPTRLRAEHLLRSGAALSASKGPDGFDFVEKIFENIASDYLGFSWRHTPFARLRERVSPEEIWIVLENNEPVGYVFARKDNLLLKINIQLLRMGIDVVEVIAAIVSELKASYVQVTMSRPSDIIRVQRAGWRVAHPTWGAFMVKPLIPSLLVEDACQLFGIGTDRFLISWLDIT
jgi:hypothetical protein